MFEKLKTIVRNLLNTPTYEGKYTNKSYLDYKDVHKYEGNAHPIYRITVLDYIDDCYSYEEGEVIYDLIKDSLHRGEKVHVSFKGVRAANTAFINATLIRLLDDYDFSFIQERIVVLDSTRSLNNLIKQRFEFVTNSKLG